MKIRFFFVFILFVLLLVLGFCWGAYYKNSASIKSGPFLYQHDSSLTISSLNVCPDLTCASFNLSQKGRDKPFVIINLKAYSFFATKKKDLEEQFIASDPNTRKVIIYQDVFQRKWFYFVNQNAPWAQAEYYNDNFIYSIFFSFDINEFKKYAFSDTDNFIKSFINNLEINNSQEKVYDTREKLTVDQVYGSAQLITLQKYLYNFDDLNRMSFPKKEGQKVYLFDCDVTSEGMEYIGHLATIEKTRPPAAATLEKLLEFRYGGFPAQDEISGYAKYSNLTLKNKLIGVNGVNLNKDGVLEINFFDAVRAYGGGSSRIGCMHAAVLLTALQFPTIKDVKMCIDKFPSRENNYCDLDFQP